MVIPLRPGKFYGSSLPRPRFYTDVKFNSHRVDEPVSPIDPLLSWAHEAHWSMGGLSFKHLRYQGRIEGNAERLRKQREKLAKKKGVSPNKPIRVGDKRSSDSVSPPPAPAVTKKRKLVVEEEEDDWSEEEMEVVKKKMPVRKLIGDFDKVATEKKKKGSLGIKIKNKNKKNESDFGSVVVGGVRTSSRLASKKI